MWALLQAFAAMRERALKTKKTNAARSHANHWRMVRAWGQWQHFIHNLLALKVQLSRALDLWEFRTKTKSIAGWAVAASSLAARRGKVWTHQSPVMSFT